MLTPFVHLGLLLRLASGEVGRRPTKPTNSEQGNEVAHKVDGRTEVRTPGWLVDEGLPDKGGQGLEE